jgi:hypothetical protein
MYVFRLGFLDGKYGFMVAVLYGFQDYVSKSKFREITGGKFKLRCRLQDHLMKRIISIFIDKNSELAENYLDGYRKCFSAGK